MSMKCVGVQKVNYTNKDGNTVNGTRLHVIYEDEKVQGYATDVIWATGNSANHVKVDDVIDVSYNKYGKVSNITVK